MSRSDTPENEPAESTDQIDEQREAIAFHTAAGKPAGEIAELVSCHPRTVKRRRQEQSVKDRIAEIRRELFAESSGRLIALLRESGDRLEELLRSKDEAVQLRAVKLVLQAAAHRMQVEDIERRLTELEKRNAPKH